MIKKLDWDSNFFKLKVGEIIFDENYKEEDLSDFDLIYVVSDRDFGLRLESFDNTYAETKVIYSKILTAGDHNLEPVFSFGTQNINVQELYGLAFESGKNSRFLIDKRFNENHFKELYKAWIDNSINKKVADDVLIYYEKNVLKGFVSYKEKDNTASIGLIAVNPSFQGKGIGAKLLQYLEKLVLDKGIQQLIIPTQLNNIPACNFYAKQGYEIESKKYIKHYWKK